MNNPFFIQSGSIGSVRSDASNTPMDESPETLDVRTDSRMRHFLGITIPGRRFALAGMILTLSFVLLSGRAFFLQVVNGGHYASLAESNRVRTYTLVPPRGIIYDRFGTILVQNAPSFAFTMTYADLPTDAAIRSSDLDRAATVAGIPRTELDLLLPVAKQDPLDPFVVRRGIPYESAMRLAIAEPLLPGFRLSETAVRSYSLAAPTLSHVLGYTGNISEEEYADFAAAGYRRTDEIGKTGIERSEEEVLRGTTGSLLVEVDSHGHELSVDGRTEPVAGKNLTLTIDLDLQAFAEARLSVMLSKLGLRKASIIAIDPRDGSIRAMVSEPTFDSNAFSSGIDQEAYAALIADPAMPLFNRSISGEYPPGSTFKPYVSYTALADGVIDAKTSFLSTGGIRVGEWFFPDWKAGGHGITDVRKAIAESVNTFFYIVGGGLDDFTGLGVERIADGARKFGFGSPTNVRLPGEADGFLPSKEWKQEAKGERWYVGDTYHLAIGQGDMLATPLQIAAANATIANGGTRFVPGLVEKVGDELVEPIQASDSLESSSIQIVREGMRQAVTKGSARSLSTLSQTVAGKTGTAQAPGDVPTHAWFEGFGPYEDPTLSVVVLIENGGEGSSVAVPIAKDIFEWWFANRPNG